MITHIYDISYIGYLMKTILFLCTENSARSIMAEALVNNLYADEYRAFSAGTSPSRIDRRTLKAIENFGLSTEGLSSKSISEIEGQQFDYTITLCDKAQLECQIYDFGGERLAWDFQDPKNRNVLMPFEQTLKELNERFKMFMLVKQKQPKALSIKPLEVFKCLADETRLASTALIADETELCVCELTAALELSQPKISRHLALMREIGLLTDRRQGQWVFYQINPALPDWASVLVKNTQEQLKTELNPLKKRLNAMTTRPDRQEICCK
jgi:ArsR family transcriptional regulator